MFFKKKFFSLIIYRLLFLHQKSQRGSTLVVAMAMGIIVIGATTLAITQAGQDKTNAVSDEMTKQAQAVAEVGITRVQGLLAKEPRLATVSNHTQWTTLADLSPTATTTPTTLDTRLNNAVTTALGTTSTPNNLTYNCDSTGSTGTIPLTPVKAQTIIEELNGGVINISSTAVNSNNTWVDLGNNKGKYKLVSYTRETGNISKGILTIQGKIANNSSSTAQIQVEFDANITSGGVSTVSATEEAVPALWITDIKAGDSFGQNSFGNNNINGKVKISDPNCTFTILPTSAQNGDNPPTGSQFAIEKSKEPMPPTPDLPPTFNTSVNRISGNLDQTLPSSNISGTYHYRMADIDLKRTLTIKPNTKVIIYLQGNFNMQGTANISIPSTSSLEIYGNTNGKYGCASGQMIPCNTNNVNINGGAITAKLFIHAPNAKGGVNGGGSSNPNFNGSLWLKGWNGSSSNSGILLQANGSYGNYLSSAYRTVPSNTFPKSSMGNISKWLRTKAN